VTTVPATFPLPENPSLEQLRKQAKDLRDFSRAGVPGALELVGAHHPKGPHAVTLTGAQMVVARHYGFASWPRLKAHIETLERYGRNPDEVHETASTEDEFLALACLRFGDDDTPDRWTKAADILAEHPELRTSSVHVAAAAADEPVLRELLGRDRGLALAEGGPYGWEPLLYLAYARHDPSVSEEATLGSVRLLLDHGADPNAGYLWHGMCPPFTALTGAFGPPEHPHGFALAELLLEAGADANDGQTLYNRMFDEDDRHLELLFAHGLGRGDGGPWAHRMGHVADSPYQELRGQLWWAIVHDMGDRVRLLIDNGTDFLTPYEAPGGRPFGLRTSAGRTPAEVAALSGCPELAEWLVGRGAAPPRGEGVDGLIAAVLAGDRARANELAGYVAVAREERPGLVVWATARRKPEAVAHLVELGWDVNALGRSDGPVEQAWQTALHDAAGRDDVELARMLLDLGADTGIEDARFHSTPIGWARHFEHPDMAALLEAATR
jgi:ankyrin repeat protein